MIKIHDVLRDVTIIDLNQVIKQTAIKLRRQYSLKLPDAIIAATAVFVKAELLSNDIKLARVTEISVKTLALKIK